MTILLVLAIMLGIGLASLVATRIARLVAFLRRRRRR